MIIAKQGLTVLEALVAGANIEFNNGSFIYEDAKKLYPHRHIKNDAGESHKAFPATEDGMFEALKFLQ